MGLNKPSLKVTKVYGKYGRSIKSRKGEPNSIVDFYDEITGKLLQQRWYYAKGQAVWDRDWDHNNSHGAHVFPHDHPWIWNPEGERQEAVDYINKEFE